MMLLSPANFWRVLTRLREIELFVVARFVVAMFVVGGTYAAPVEAATFVGLNPAIHNRYDGTSPNPTFLINESKITGIAGKPGTTASRAHLISPFHILTSRHTGEPAVRYRKSDGTFVTLSVVSGVESPSNPNGFVNLTTDLGGGMTAVSDIRLYRLTAPVPASYGITPMPIYDGDDMDIQGKTMFVMGRDNKAGRNTMRDVVLVETSGGLVKTFTTAHTYDDDPGHSLYDGVGNDEIKFVSGDSGHATLLQVGSQMTLVGLNLGADPDGMLYDGLHTNFSSFLAPYLDEIDSIVTSDGYSITTVSATPEPSSFACLALAMGVCMIRRRR